jgi:hypothetical protein
VKTRHRPLFDDHANEVLLSSVSLAECARVLRNAGMSADEVDTTLDAYLPLFSEIVPVNDPSTAPCPQAVGAPASAPRPPSPPLHPQQQPSRLLQRILKGDQKLHRLAPVDNAMALGQRQIKTL